MDEQQYQDETVTETGAAEFIALLLMEESAIDSYIALLGQRRVSCPFSWFHCCGRELQRALCFYASISEAMIAIREAFSNGTPRARAYIQRVLYPQFKRSLAMAWDAALWDFDANTLVQDLLAESPE